MSRGAVAAALVLAASPVILSSVALAAQAAPPWQPLSTAEPAVPSLDHQLAMLQAALVSLPLATALGAALAFRPRRSGTPPRSAAVVQTQIILAIVGALVMLIVGASLARAFGIVGVASLVRYRAKIEDPKDAGVMLSALGIGLASGVGLHMLAIFGTAFIAGVLWFVESFEPRPLKLFTLKVTSADPAKIRPRLERLLRRSRAQFELRTSSAHELWYEVGLPIETGTDTLANEILRLGGSPETAVEWDEKKKNK